MALCYLRTTFGVDHVGRFGGRKAERRDLNNGSRPIARQPEFLLFRNSMRSGFQTSAGSASGTINFGFRAKALSQSARRPGSD